MLAALEFLLIYSYYIVRAVQMEDDNKLAQAVLEPQMRYLPAAAAPAMQAFSSAFLLEDVAAKRAAARQQAGGQEAADGAGDRGQKRG